MLNATALQYFQTAALSGAIAGVLLYILSSVWTGSKKQSVRVSRNDEKTTAIFLFRAGVLVDANRPALKLCQGSGDLFWDSLHQILSRRFPDFPARQGSFEAQNMLVLESYDDDDPATITIDQWGDTARVSVECNSYAQTQSEIISKQVVLDAPYPIWKTDAENRLVWHNLAYQIFSEKLGYGEPLGQKPIFDIGGLYRDKETVRTGVSHPEKSETFWFDVKTYTVNEETVFYATDADAIVRAEIAQRNFVQTLTKTFAQLSIGLAIFDKDRQLALFNPALIDLTTLPAEFLSSRPSVLSFFDRMRDSRVMPEPKSYASWREQIADLVIAASDGRYAETWTLPSGLTYRVSGRPHPDGAIAFLFEDISAEISLTRHFRAEIELSQSVLDTLDSGLVLFSASGKVALCNQAYCELWTSDPEEALGDYGLRDALLVWRAASTETEVWDRLKQTVSKDAERLQWSDEVVLKSGQVVGVRVSPVLGGAILVRFDERPSFSKTGLSA